VAPTAGKTAVVAVLVLALAVVMSVTSMGPPPAAPASAPPTEFSGMRALRIIESIATKPHPTGTAAAADVRAYLTRELEGLGFDVHVQEATLLTEALAKRWGVAVLAARIHNVVARRRGTSLGPAVLLMAHYDSRELTPGASDDGYGCATLLETARALAASPPLRHDVVLLITEGEEQWLLGARAFFEESPIAKEVALALNFDMRGNQGPVQMFQTSDHAAGLIDVLASSVSRVTASSLSQEVYRRMPNDTDLTPWLQAGHAGMNFGAIDGFARYHQPTDTAANADAATVQHMGSYALALTRAFADRQDIVHDSAQDAVYFTTGPLFVHYSVRAAIALAGLAAALVAFVIGAGLRGRRLGAGGVLAGGAVAVLGPVIAGLLAQGVWWAVDHAHSGALGTQHVRSVPRTACVAGMVLLGAGVQGSIVARTMGRVRSFDLSVGAMFIWGALALTFALMLPGGSYLFVWPVLAWGPFGVWTTWRSLDDVRQSAMGTHLVAPVFAILLFVPLALQLGIAFGPPLAPALAAIGALAATTTTTLIGAPQRGQRWIAPASLAFAAAASIVFAAVSAPYDARSPRPDSLVYAIDANGRASWLSFDAAPDEWTSRALRGASRALLPALFPRSDVLEWQTEAPRVAREPPAVDLTSEAREAAKRTLRFHVSLPPETEIVTFDVPPESHAVSATVQGIPFGPEPRDGWLELAFFGPPAEGLDLAIVAESGHRFSLTAVRQSRGLPPELATQLGPRPPDRMPAVVQMDSMHASDMTLVSSVLSP
jgi:hypothetical protein